MSIDTSEWFFDDKSTNQSERYSTLGITGSQIRTINQAGGLLPFVMSYYSDKTEKMLVDFSQMTTDGLIAYISVIINEPTELEIGTTDWQLRHKMAFEGLLKQTITDRIGDEFVFESDDVFDLLTIAKFKLQLLKIALTALELKSDGPEDIMDSIVQYLAYLDSRILREKMDLHARQTALENKTPVFRSILDDIIRKDAKYTNTIQTILESGEYTEISPDKHRER